MEIEVLRIGQRVVRDDRVTTHVALVARSFGAQKIYMNEVNPEIKRTISGINKTWGGNFKIEIISEWKKIVKEKKNEASVTQIEIKKEDTEMDEEEVPLERTFSVWKDVSR